MIRPGKQTGYILLPVIVVITLVAAIALLMNTESALESNTAASELNAQQAQYVAEAGMNHALWLARQQGCGPYGNLTNEPLANDNYSSTLTTDLGSTNAVTINVDQDSWISSDSPADNKGNDQNLHIRFEGGVIERPMFRYDLSPIPAKAVILSVTAWFYVDQEHPEGQVDIHRITADWSEADATWDSMGANLDFPVLAVIPAQPDMGVWVSVNLTSQVQAWVNGQSNFGITLNSTSEGTNGDYNSRESANPPYLEVIVGTPPSSPAVLKAVGTLANGVTRSLVRDEIGLIQSPSQLLQLQPDGAEVMDTYLDQSNPGYNNGISDSLWLEQASGNDDDHVLLKFPLGRIPIDARIQQASLQLYQSLGTTSGGEVSIHRVRREWEEGNDSFTNGPGVTWNNATTTEVWAVAGGEFDAAAIATTTINPSTTGYYDWDITPLVQGWMANQIGNHGMMIVADTTGTLLRFRSSDHGTVVERPKLTVTYSCTCGEVCVPPQGNGKVLLLRNRNDPDPTDTQKQALFESWGYTVNLLDDWDDQATYNAAMASNDVMFISGASPFAVGNKLNNAPIGVVNERGELNDELGIATGRASPVGDSIDVIDTDHYITSIFTNAPLQVMTAGVELTTVGGTTAPSAQVLAEIGGIGALVTLDKGGLNSNGDTAPARRVLLPAGESEVDWLMTNNGALIVQRAIEWGIGDKKTLDDENIILSTAGGATLGGLTFTDKDLAEYDPVTDNGSLYLDGVALSLAQDIDAVHVLANGHIVLSAINTITLGSITSENEDLIDYDPVADSATLMFDGSALFTSGSTDISAVHVLDNGHLLLTNEYTATLGGLSFGPNDIVDYDPVANSATLFFDGDAVGFSGWIDALHLLSNGNIVLSANTTNTLGTLSFHSGDLIEYDPVADLATLYLDGDLFSAEENIRSAHVGPGTGGDAPIGPYNVLFVVGNVGGPGMTAEEIDHRTLIESWGHTVEIIDDGASQTDFDTAVANNDVVFT
ncbi:MAG: DNRLRE domain-containing protein, partial [Gammaproteobacteria bacterium]|nr:DNRLRE domain-containing protein [Gammaproteobacteria bacterium]